MPRTIRAAAASQAATEAARLLGQRIRQAREEHQLSRPQLAALVASDPSAVWRWEKGLRMPNGTTLGRLAAALSTDVAELLSGLDYAPDPEPAGVQPLDDPELVLAVWPKLSLATRQACFREALSVR
jgi:transcriptional regulator with XRE-family HTH domain